jgi:hypothetical protein
MIQANVEMKSAYEMQAALDHFACQPTGSGLIRRKLVLPADREGCLGIIPANRNNAAYHKLYSRGIQTGDDRETQLAKHRNRPDEQRTSEYQCREHCAASLERLSLAANFATSLVALGKGILGKPYLLAPTL